jgi:hypothetical protein
MVFNATFNNISVILWRSVYLWRIPESIHFDLSWEFDSLKKNNKRIFHAKTQLPEEFLYDKVLRRNSTFCHNTFVYIIVSYLFVIYKSVVCYLY